MSLLGYKSRMSVSAVFIAIFGLLFHMAVDALPPSSPKASVGEKALSSKQKQFFSNLRKARARLILAGSNIPLSIEDFAQNHKADIALLNEIDMAAGAPGSEKNRSDRNKGGTTADDCPRCLSNYDPLIGLVLFLDNEQLTRAEDRIVCLPPISDPKRSRAHVLFNIRAPPLFS